MSFVTLAQFEARFGGPVPVADEGMVTAFLEDACAMVADLVDTTYTSEADVPGAIIGVICTAVRRAYDNPTGLRGETIGDYSWTGGGAASGIYFTVEEQRTIRRAAGKLGASSLTLEGMLPAPAMAEQYLGDVNSPEAILWFAQEDLV